MSDEAVLRASQVRAASRESSLWPDNRSQHASGRRLMASQGHAFYGDGTPVLLGDHVELRVWVKLFRKLPGTVVYVPGISKRRGEMEHGGLTWVGIRMDDDGAVVGTIVDPTTERLVKRVTLLRRGDPQELSADVELEG